ncbi:hypothetical protein IscW_ISCW011470 [Ixodes scapularis]|uniref:Uncharacterized protein n=1 Tax=Ixodes scapularis TaxID=6945 RepID=B7Q839_IXOSC|nr:hypothetical protein IscW_ISCW011470 [Ixodes scapularis]|eukprot:XP_002412278.1 hypothetical protein IscW_ISCW011470 [Ixodes scapularis]
MGGLDQRGPAVLSELRERAQLADRGPTERPAPRRGNRGPRPTEAGSSSARGHTCRDEQRWAPAVKGPGTAATWAQLGSSRQPTTSLMKAMYMMARRRVSIRERRFSYANVGTCTDTKQQTLRNALHMRR